MISILSMFACFMGNGPEAEEVAAAEAAAKAALAAAEGAAAEGAAGEGAATEEGAPSGEAKPAAEGAAPTAAAEPVFCDPEKSRMHEITVSKSTKINFKKDSTFNTDGVYDVWAIGDDSKPIGKIKMTVKDGLILSGEASQGGFIFCDYNDDFGYDGLPVDRFCVNPSAFKATKFSIEVTADFYEYTLANCQVTVEG
ncbi:MAG: hypothetical protein VXZ96_03260 [Myxococcota bacterium]|nr:hypothetical protein [Myxococcota bacterium]